MSNANNDEQFDANSELRKADVLRGRDIIPGSPPYGNKTGQEENLQETTQNDPYPPAEAETSLETEQRRSEIPRFNLAEKIMAEQRRITAVRRKGPGQTDEAQKQEREAESAGHTIGQPTAALSEQEQIIVEIVARDVERLCLGETFRLRNG